MQLLSLTKFSHKIPSVGKQLLDFKAFSGTNYLSPDNSSLNKYENNNFWGIYGEETRWEIGTNQALALTMHCRFGLGTLSVGVSMYVCAVRV